MTGLNDFRSHPCNTPIGTTFCVRCDCDGEHRGPVAEAHSRLLDLVLGRTYSGNTLQRAIRQLIDAAQVEERNRVEASGRDAVGDDTAEIVRFRKRCEWIGRMPLLDLRHELERIETDDRRFATAHNASEAEVLRKLILHASTPAPKGEDKRNA